LANATAKCEAGCVCKLPGFVSCLHLHHVFRSTKVMRRVATCGNRENWKSNGNHFKQGKGGTCALSIVALQEGCTYTWMSPQIRLDCDTF
jgi:hypothetical protein